LATNEKNMNRVPNRRTSPQVTPVEVLDWKASEDRRLQGFAQGPPRTVQISAARDGPFGAEVRVCDPVEALGSSSLEPTDFLSLRVRKGRQNTVGREISLDNFSVALLLQAVTPSWSATTDNDRNQAKVQYTEH
jgi:hypothetical protein